MRNLMIVAVVFFVVAITKNSELIISCTFRLSLGNDPVVTNERWGLFSDQGGNNSLPGPSTLLSNTLPGTTGTY